MDTERDSRRGIRKEARTGRQMTSSVGFLLTSLLAVWLFQQFVGRQAINCNIWAGRSQT